MREIFFGSITKNLIFGHNEKYVDKTAKIAMDSKRDGPIPKFQPTPILEKIPITNTDTSRKIVNLEKKIANDALKAHLHVNIFRHSTAFYVQKQCGKMSEAGPNGCKTAGDWLQRGLGPASDIFPHCFWT